VKKRIGIFNVWFDFSWAKMREARRSSE